MKLGSFKAMLEGTIRNDDFERNTALQHCFKWLQHCSNIATLCCRAKNRCCESSRVSSPLRRSRAVTAKNVQKKRRAKLLFW